MDVTLTINKGCHSFFIGFFLIWTIFQVFIEAFTILLLFYVWGFFTTRYVGSLVPPTRDQTCTHWTGRQSFNHWTTEEVPILFFYFYFFPKAIIDNLSSQFTQQFVPGCPGGRVKRNPPASAGDTGSIPGVGRWHMLLSN